MRLIRASEIGEYVFCHRAWWLRAVQGQASVNTQALAAGAEAHAWHGRGLSLANGLRALALVLIAAAVVWWLLAR